MSVLSTTRDLAMKSNQLAIDAVAEAWASIDGKIFAYRTEADGLAQGSGTYLDYQAKAVELIRRINKRRFDVTKVTNED
jgi:hypothetical protein